jgi:DNA-binding transcriptional regulator LsrR (DeoR family)
MSNGEVVFKSRTEQRIEAETGRAVADVLRDLYHEEGLTQDQMAARLRIHRTTVVELMKRHGIPTGYNKSWTAA